MYTQIHSFQKPTDCLKIDWIAEGNLSRITDSKEQMNISILVVGRTGAGKSSLINALVGMDVAKTGSGPMTVTRKVERIVVNKSGIGVHIIDTPGFHDNILEEARKQSEDIDLFLYCHDMRTRFLRTSYLTNELKAIGETFGMDIWEKGMFALTFANTFHEKNTYISLLHDWDNALRESIKDIIDPEVAERIPIVPTGFKEPQLPDRPSWVSEFWIQGFRRMDYKAMVLFAQLNRERIHNTMTDVDPMDRNPEDQLLVTSYMSQDERRIDPRYIPWAVIVGGVMFSVMYMMCCIKLPSVALALFAGAYVGNWMATFVSDNLERIADNAITHSLVVTYFEENSSMYLYLIILGLFRTTSSLI